MNKLNLWKRGDEISASKLNEPVKALNSLLTNQNQNNINVDSTGGLNNCNSLNLADENIADEDNVVYLIENDNPTLQPEAGENLVTEEGWYFRKGGIENGYTTDYAAATLTKIDADKLNGLNGNEDKTIFIKIVTDEYGNVVTNDLEIKSSSDSIYNNYWKGPNDSATAENPTIYRRIGRILNHPFAMADGKPKNFVIKTNDITMPIIPVKGEAIRDSDTATVVGDIEGNSIIVKNLVNKGGITFNADDRRLDLKSGIELVAFSSDSYSGSLVAPDAGTSLTPNAFDLSIPIYTQPIINEYNGVTRSWVTSSSSSIATASLKAKSIKDNWKIALGLEGNISMPTYKAVTRISADSTQNAIIVTPSYAGNGITDYRLSFNTAYATGPSIPAPIQITGDSWISVTSPTTNQFQISWNEYGSSGNYTFDDWFVVSGDSISLNTTKLNNFAQSVANEITVDVMVEGLVDGYSSSGEINVNTSGLAYDGSNYNATTNLV